VPTGQIVRSNESMLSVEKGLRELTSVKVEDAVVFAMAQHRRPNLVRVGQAFPDLKSPVDSPNLVEAFELCQELWSGRGHCRRAPSVLDWPK
jgi:hypothetical protein